MQVSPLRKQYTVTHAAWTDAFPNIQPPDASWWQNWFRDNDYTDILEAIRVLRSHSAPVRARYSTESIGRAITAMLREIALRRAIPLSAPKDPQAGGQS